MITIADTSGILALFNSSDPEHRAVRSAADKSGLLVVSPLSLTEVHQVATIRATRAAADHIIETITRHADHDRIRIAETSPRMLTATIAIRRHYDTLDLDLADAAAVVLAAEYRTDTILTLDRRDFRALRPLTPHEAFRLVPDDL